MGCSVLGRQGRLFYLFVLPCKLQGFGYVCTADIIIWIIIWQVQIDCHHLHWIDYWSWTPKQILLVFTWNLYDDVARCCLHRRIWVGSRVLMVGMLLHFHSADQVFLLASVAVHWLTTVCFHFRPSNTFFILNSVRIEGVTGKFHKLFAIFRLI